MSFRTRLLSFFAVIVVIPMIAVGVLVYRLIGDSAQGKADARANGLATAAARLYTEESLVGRAEAMTMARKFGLLSGGGLRTRLDGLRARSGLTRVSVSDGTRTLADAGDLTAVAPGIATVTFTATGRRLDLAVSELTAAA